MQPTPRSSLSNRARWLIYFAVIALLIAVMVLSYYSSTFLAFLIIPLMVYLYVDAWKRQIRSSKAFTKRLDPSGVYAIPVEINPDKCSNCGYDCAGIDRLFPCPECGKPATIPTTPKLDESRCFFCGYKRDGLDKDAVCPECGKAQTQPPMRPYQR